MRHTIYTLLLALVSTVVFAQGDTVKINSFGKDILLNASIKAMVDESHDIKFEDLTKKVWLPLEKFKGLKLTTGPNVWLRLHLENKSDKQIEGYLNSVLFRHEELYTLVNGTCTKAEICGSLATPSESKNFLHSSFFTIELSPNETKTFYILGRNIQSTTYMDKEIFLYTRGSADAWMLDYTSARLPVNIHDGILMGVLLVILVYFLFHYINDRSSKYYLWYVLYLLFMLLYRLRDVETHTNINILFSHFKFSHHYTANPLLFLSFLAYTGFLLSFLNLTKADGLGYKAIKFSFWFLSIYVLADIVVNCTLGLNAGYSISKYAYLPSVALGLITVWAIYKRPGKLGRYVVLGIGCLLVFALVGQIIRALLNADILNHNNFSAYRKYPWAEPGFYMRNGIILEVLIFSFGLSYKNKLEKIERAKSEMRALIGQIYNHQMKNGTMNLIGLIRDEKKEEAIRYVRDFSSLMNEAVQLVNEDEITLFEELHFIEHYLDVMRIATGEFEYKVNVPDRNQLKEIMVPPLLLQPLIENALSHGVIKSKTGKWLRLTVDAAIGTGEIRIENAGPKYDPTQATREGSTGFKATESRLKYFSELNAIESKLTIAPGEEEGALVTITIKHKR
jgi:hypothetical protein